MILQLIDFPLRLNWNSLLMCSPANVIWDQQLDLVTFNEAIGHETRIRIPQISPHTRCSYDVHSYSVCFCNLFLLKQSTFSRGATFCGYFSLHYHKFIPRGRNMGLTFSFTTGHIWKERYFKIKLCSDFLKDPDRYFPLRNWTLIFLSFIPRGS